MSTLITQDRAAREKLLIELEYRRCRDDFRYWVSNYCYIPSQREEAGGTGRELFKLFDYQQEWAEGLLTRKHLLFLKCRQVGATTLTMAYALWLLQFKRGGARVTVISKDQDAASSNLMMLGSMYRWQPEWLKARGPKLVGDAMTQWKWAHADGSTSLVASMPATDRAGAGTTPNLVVLDEADLYNNTGGFGSVWAVVEPSTLAADASPTNSGAVCVVISTARNPGGLFAKLYWGGRKGSGRFKSYFVSWRANRFMWTDGKPDEAKREAKRRELGDAGREHEFVRDYPDSDVEAFQLSGQQFFTHRVDDDDDTEEGTRGKLVRDGKAVTFRPAEHGQLYVHQMPRADRDYVLSIDPAHGRGGDATVAQVFTWDEDGEPALVAYWHSNTVEQHLWAPVMADLGRFYGGTSGEALLVIETTGGHAELPLHVLRNEERYSNLYTYVPKTRNRGRRAEATPGFNTAGAGGKRMLALNTAQELLPRLSGIYPDLATELRTFVVRDNGFVAADKGLHDDHVMALAIGLFALRERIRAATVPTSSRQPDSSNAHHQAIAQVISEEKARIKREELQKTRAFHKKLRRQASRSHRRTRR